MRSHIERGGKIFAAGLFCALVINFTAGFFTYSVKPICAAAEQGGGENAVREKFTDEQFAEAAAGVIEYALGDYGDDADKNGGSGLAAKFIAEGSAGSSAADWFMIAERALGYEDDYAGYIGAAQARDYESELLTEPARRSITAQLLGGEGFDMSGYSLEGAGCNELIWTALSQKICGCDDGDALAALSDCIRQDGGMGLMGSETDITAMSLLVLDGGDAERAERWLYENYDSGGMTCETAAWYIIGFAARGKAFDSPAAVRPVDTLMSCRNPDGGFAHIAGGESQPLSTAQAALALAAMAQMSAGGRLFGGEPAAVDLAAQENLSCDFFDSFDESRLDEIRPTAAANPELRVLCERAELFAGGEQTARARELLEESSRRLGEVERLNGEIRESFYPADRVKLWRYGELCEINRRVNALGEDRALALSADELAAREKRLRAELCALAVILTIAVVAAAVKICLTAKKLRNGKVEK